MKRNFCASAFLAIVFALAGCSSGDDSSSSSGSSSSTTSVYVINETSGTITEVYFSPTSEDTWGSNQLGSSTLSSGATFKMTGVPCPDDYDLRLVNTGGEVAEDRDRYIGCSLEYTYTINSF